MTDQFPSQHREAIDHVWKAMPGDPQPLAKIVLASGVDKPTVQRILKAASITGVVFGQNGRWAHSAPSRLAFRDAVVYGVLADGPLPAGALAERMAGLASGSQLYWSLRRLREMGAVVRESDGSRSPVYRAAAD